MCENVLKSCSPRSGLQKKGPLHSNVSALNINHRLRTLYISSGALGGAIWDAEKLPVRSFYGRTEVDGISAWKIVLPDGRCADDVPTDATVRQGFKR